MTNSDQLIENLEQIVLDQRYSILIEHFPISFNHFVNKESILKLIMNRIISLIFNDDLNRSQLFVRKVKQEALVLLNSGINELSYDVAEKSCICLTKLFNVELVSIERLDLFVVFLSHYFAEFMEEDVLSLVYAVILGLDKVRYGHPWSSFLGKVQQLASILEVDFP